MIHPVVCNPVLGPLVGVKDPVRWLAGRGYPSGAILHFDANLDPYTEQTGGPHTFNHAVLSPQYQRAFDGSYTDVGAKPAVDTFDGEKWLRSCGAVTNLLPSGAEDISEWGTNNCTVSPEGSFYRLTATGTEYSYVRKYISAPTVGQKYTVSRRVKRGSTGFCTIGFHGHPDAYFNLDDLTYYFTGTGAVGASITDDGDGWRIISATWQYQGGTIYAVFFALTSVFGSQNSILVGDHIYMSNPQLTATAYPVPYTPPGTTMPASNATTTNGMWFALPDGSPLWKALTGQADGVELVTNGGFDSADGWVLVGSGWQITNGALQASASIASSMRQYISGSAGAYLIRLNYSSTVGDFVIRFSSGDDFVTIAGTTWYSGNGTVSVNLVVPSSFDRVRVYSGGGSGFTGSIDNISIQRIQPQPLTLATRVRMGVGSGDLPNSAGNENITAVTNAPWGLSSIKRFVAGTHLSISAYDGARDADSSYSAWPRNAIIRRVTQVNTAGTQFRVGYMIEGAHTEIQWSAWVAYDGSFDPSTLYRLMLGYNNPYPMWFNKITAWKEQVSDALIMEAMA